MITGFVPQDTIKPTLVIRINTDNLIPDSVFRKLDEVPAFIKYADSLRLNKRIFLPIGSYNNRYHICLLKKQYSDFTCFDPAGFLRKVKPYPRPVPFSDGSNYRIA